YHGKPRNGFQHRHGGDVESVARGGLKGPDAAFAENDFRVAAGGYDLGGLHQFVEARGHSAFQQDGTAAAAERLQQRIVFHAARSDLHDVGVLGDDVDIALAHHFRDDGEAGLFPGFGKELEAFHTEALKRIWGGARFVSASAKHARSGSGNELGGLQDLLLRFDRARPRHDDKAAVSDR